MKYNLEHWKKHRLIRNTDGRYYTVSLKQDIMGEWLIKNIWGGKTKTAGVVKVMPVKDVGTAESVIESIRHRRISHGYSLSY